MRGAAMWEVDRLEVIEESLPLSSMCVWGVVREKEGEEERGGWGRR
jgi:hypothetical protein